jgi:chemotaxis protein methyltransferase CheR
MNATASSSGARADFVLGAAEFDRLRELVREHTGISLSEAKRQLVYGRLVRRLRALELTSFADYIQLLEEGDETELEEFTNAVTTNLTSFFREGHHFEHLAREVLPHLVQRNAQSRRIRIWCCAASTGEEPYSIAITLQEQRQLLNGWDVRVLATDLDSKVLAHGAQGIYEGERVAGLSATRQERFFRPVAGAPGKLQVSADLQQKLVFKRLNLMHEWPMHGPLDVVFCRNVVIYFDKDTQRVLFERIAQLQRPGDVLFLGHSESLYRVTERYELIGRTIYRRVQD